MHVMGLRTRSIYRRSNVTVEADVCEALDRMYRAEGEQPAEKKDGSR